MNSKKLLGIGFCFGIATVLFGLVHYQMNYADADAVVVGNGKDVLHVLANQKDLTILSNLINTSGLHPILEKLDEVTIIAPTNQAFDRLRTMLGDDAYNRIIRDRRQLERLLKNHIILNKESIDEITKEGELNTFQGASIPVSKSDQGTVRFNGRASVIPTGSNISTDKGYIHTIDEVMVPDRLE